MLQRMLADSNTAKAPFVSSYDSMPLQRRGQVEEVAKMFAFLLSDDSSYVTGAIFPVDGGMTA